MLGLTAANSRPVVEKNLTKKKKTIHLDPHYITSKLNTTPHNLGLVFHSFGCGFLGLS